MSFTEPRPRRAVLYVPASNAKALAKTASLDADVLIYDLEDSVAPAAKNNARDQLRRHFEAGAQIAQPNTASQPEQLIRINPLSTEWGAGDIKLAVSLKADGIILPKAESPQQIIEASAMLDDLDAAPGMAIWAMIETPRGILNADEIARLAHITASRLQCFIVGGNDIALSTGVKSTNQRAALIPWLMQIVLAARAGGMTVLDGVYNDFHDHAGFEAECLQSSDLGFDGKTLIHPAQIKTALAAFSPSIAEIEWAQAVTASFADPQNAQKGAVALNGTMIERLHLIQAARIISRSHKSN